MTEIAVRDAFQRWPQSEMTCLKRTLSLRTAYQLLSNSSVFVLHARPKRGLKLAYCIYKLNSQHSRILNSEYSMYHTALPLNAITDQSESIISDCCVQLCTLRLEHTF